jgi:hypothetical protein
MWKFKSPFINIHPGRLRASEGDSIFTTNILSRIGTEGKVLVLFRRFRSKRCEPLKAMQEFSLADLEDT